MTINVDWQVELNGVTIGAGTPFLLTGPINGLGIPAPRGSDQERGDRAGYVASYDIFNRRVITVQIGIDGTGPGNAWDLFETLKIAWTPTVTDIAFDLRLPGFESVSRRFYGRPRGLEPELARLPGGFIDALATFDALDPFAYGNPTETTLGAGTTTITNPGHIDTDRYTVGLAATGNPVVFANTVHNEPALTLTDVTGPVILDGRTHTVTDDTGTDLYNHLLAGSGWPVLAPGPNPIELTGATGTITYRPAYL